MIKSISYFAQYLIFWIFIHLGRCLPFQLRVKLSGLFFKYTLSFLSKFQQRIDDNLALTSNYIHPKDVKQFKRACFENYGRTMAENFSARGFKKQINQFHYDETTLQFLKNAHDKGQPIIILSAHFGNWESIRAVLSSNGMETGAIYRPQNNPYFERDFLIQISIAGKPVFAKGRAGMRAMMAHIKAGGITSVLIDQKEANSPRLEFLGCPATTSLVAAEMALRYDALLVPAYGVRSKRNPNEYHVKFETPIPHSTALEMTQLANDSISNEIILNPEQWFWIHRRWD